VVVVVTGPDEAVIEPAPKVVVGPDVITVLVVRGAVPSVYQATPKTISPTTTSVPKITLCLMWNLKFVVRIELKSRGSL
jgi:hypothetical protein